MSSVLLAVLVSVLAAIDECAQCTSAALCATHVAAQAAAIKEAKPELRAKEPRDRILALQKIARISGEHPALPSSEAAELVASALADESYAVKAEAAQLLAGDLHPEVAVRALVGGLEQMRKDLGKLGGGGGRYGGGQEDAKDPRVVEQRKQREEATKYAQALVAGLGGMADDRSVDALAEFLMPLARRNGGDLLTPTAEALVHLGSRKAAEALVQKMKSAPAPGGGGPWGPDTTRKTLHDLLVGMAREKGADETPAWSEKEPPDWEAWLAKNQKRFPAKLGKYDLEKMRKSKP